MDLVASCRDKLEYFRIKELKDVLTTFGMSKQGKKQDLVERILSVLPDEQAAGVCTKKNTISKEEVAKQVDDIYRKMQVSGATELASKGQGVLESSTTKVKGENENLYLVRCLCGSSLETNSMIKCEDPRCQARQHIDCVIVPEKLTDSMQFPESFYCEICRLSRADPFWVTERHPLNPVKLVTTNIPTDGSEPMQSAEKTFHLTRADKDLLTKQEYDIQAWCMLLNDKVPFRMQWPKYADLQINGVLVRAINRPGSQLLGANGRDDGPVITPCIKDGINKISLTGCDARVFCVGVRIVKRRTVQQILNLIPKESDGESFEDALARIRRCVGGGNQTDTADSDSDIEVVADSFVVNLRCPMSGSRMKVAGRFKPCAHMGCFDLDVFVEMNQSSRKWQCPICLKNYSLEYIVVDPYFNRVTSKMRHCSEDITEIDVKPDGSWRVKTKTEAECRDLGELAQWHNPDSSPCVLNGDELKPKPETWKQVKQEVYSDGHTGTGLKLGIRKNRIGLWEVSKPEDANTSSSGNEIQNILGNNEHKVIPMSSSATGSGGEDPSVNQDGGGNFDAANNGIELDSLSLNVDSAYGLADRHFSAPAENEVIILSDSDDDNDLLMSTGSMYNTNQAVDGGANFPAAPVIADHYLEDPTLGSGGNSCLGLFNPNEVEFGMPIWQLPPGSQAGPGFQLFNSDVPDALVDMLTAPINCASSMNGYGLVSEATMATGSMLPDSQVGRLDAEMNDGLVDNPLAFGGEDPSLQIFLPTKPSNPSLQSDIRNPSDVSNGARTDDWISLRLGGGATGDNNELTPFNGWNSTQQILSGQGSIKSLADTASLLLGMSDSRSAERAGRQGSDSPFTFPRQKRSVRPRLNLSIDSESE